MSLPPCSGKHALFDSTDIHDHHDAAALCVGCPMLAACQERLDDEFARGHTPVGTWAGRLVRNRYERTAPSGHPDIEERMFTDDEARAAMAAYARGERSHRAIIGARVHNRRLAARREVAA